MALCNVNNFGFRSPSVLLGEVPCRRGKKNHTRPGSNLGDSALSDIAVIMPYDT